MVLKPTGKDVKQLKAIDRLIEADEVEVAFEQLKAFVRKRPKILAGWLSLVEFTFEYGYPNWSWFGLYRLTQLQPKDPDFLYDFILTCVESQMVFLAIHQAKRFVEMFPDYDDIDDIRDVLKIIDQQKVLLPPDLDLSDLYNETNALRNTVEGLLQVRQSDEARTLLLPVIEAQPEDPGLASLHASSYAYEGKLTKAIEILDEFLKRLPDEVRVIAQKVQYLIQLNRESEARELMSATLALSPENPLDWYYLCEICAYLHEHQTLLDTYKRGSEVTKIDLAEHMMGLPVLIGTAYAFLGQRRNARRYLRQAAKEAYSDAHDHLRFGKEFGPWYFNYDNWMYPAWIEEMEQFELKNPILKQQTRKDVEQLFQKYEGLEHTLSLMFTQGDPTGLSMAVQISMIYPLEGVLDFIDSKRGPDELRNTARMGAANTGLYDRELPLKFFAEGEAADVTRHMYHITAVGRSEYDMSDEAIEYLQQANAADHQNNLRLMEQSIEKGLALEPDAPPLLHSKTILLYKRGRQKKSAALTLELVEKYPDYLFGRAGMTNICINDQRLDEAETWLKPTMTRDEYHVSEILTVARLYILYLRKREAFDLTDEWIALVDAIMPGTVLDRWRRNAP